MPGWVQAGYDEYARRLPAGWNWSLTEVPLAPRQRGLTAAQYIEREEKAMLKRLPPGARSVALEVNGSRWSTRELARHLEEWMAAGPTVFLIGGPDGLGARCREQSPVHWSLSPLTLPHPLVRVILVEQLYRAWSLLQGHPYHRE